jgi:SAM-dependent methyltransferase
MLDFISNIQILFNFYPKKIIAGLRNLPYFYRSRKAFKKSLANNPDFKISRNYFCLTDMNEAGGNLLKHYFLQDLYFSQKVFENKPAKHVDIGSRIDGFVAHIASFMEVEVLDVRPLSNTIKNIYFVQADMMDTNFHLKNYCQSVSCLHVIEHLGLGRYGDKIDANGHLKGLNTIYNLLQPGGFFYFSVPVGTQRIEYNAHRIFSVDYLLNYFDSKYELLSFSYIDDAEVIHENIDPRSETIRCRYGCGLFVLKKI